MTVNVINKTLVSRSQDCIPDGFDYEVQFSEDHPTANSEGSACGFLVWKLPPDPPPMVAVATCEFVVEAGGKTLATDPVTLMLQSRERVVVGDAAENVLASKQAQDTLEALSRISGDKSAGFKKSRQLLGTVEKK